MSRLAFPFGPTALGRSGSVPFGSDAHARQLLELLIFTVPGERVMRPELGSPVRQMVFSPLASATATALQAALQAAIQQWLGAVLTVIDLTVTPADSDAAVEVAVTYETRTGRTTGELHMRRDLT